MIDTKKCQICKRPNNTLHWHIDSETGSIWVWCNGKCQRGYSLYSYCDAAGISLKELLKGDFDFHESTPNEVRRMEWPACFVPLTDKHAQKGADYVISRGLTLEGDMYYDVDEESIVFPYNFQHVFVGAQMRFIEPRYDEDKGVQKMDTLPGTRLGYLFYGWNQGPLPAFIKYVVVTEGAFNTLSLQQSLNLAYGGATKCPFKVIAASGSGATQHQKEVMQELLQNGYKVIAAPDCDEAGFKMMGKLIDAGAISHVSLTNDTEKDWNDLLKEHGHKKLAEIFIKNMKVV